MSSKILKSEEALKKQYPYYEMSIENTTYSDELEDNIDEEWCSANIKSWCYMCGDKIYAGTRRDLEKIGSLMRSIFSIEELKRDREKPVYENLNYGTAKDNPYFKVF